MWIHFGYGKGQVLKTDKLIAEYSDAQIERLSRTDIRERAANKC